MHTRKHVSIGASYKYERETSPLEISATFSLYRVHLVPLDQGDPLEQKEKKVPMEVLEVMALLELMVKMELLALLDQQVKKLENLSDSCRVLCFMFFMPSGCTRPSGTNRPHWYSGTDRIAWGTWCKGSGRGQGSNWNGRRQRRAR